MNVLIKRLVEIQILWRVVFMPVITGQRGLTHVASYYVQTNVFFSEPPLKDSEYKVTVLASLK